MRRQVLGLLSFVFAFAYPVCTKPAWAHGGQYRGPPGEVPPDSRTPSDPPPPETDGGTPTPPDTGTPTSTPPDQPNTPTPPTDGTPDQPKDSGDTPAGTGPGSGPGVRSGGGRVSRKSLTFESWRYWWHGNKDRFLVVRRGADGASGGGLGEAATSTDNAAQAQNVAARTMEARVVPLLKKYARDAKVHFDVRASAVLGLARLGRREEIPYLVALARNDGAEKVHGVVQETAALALGVMQERTPEVRRSLMDIAADDAAPTRTRCFAAVSLGLLGGKDAAPGTTEGSLAALRALVVAQGANKDLACAGLVGIGLLGDPAAVPDLLGWLRAEKAAGNPLDDLQLSYVAGALGKIGRTGLAGPDSRDVVEALRDRLLRRERLTRYSAVIALGQIAPNGSPEVRKECVSILAEVVKADGKGVLDTQSTNFALVALGRAVGDPTGADGRGGCPQDVRDRALEPLGRAFDGRGNNRPFAAFGLALASMHRDGADRVKAAERIRETLARLNGDVEQRGALVLAVGLLRDAESIGVVRSFLRDGNLEASLRGTAAVSLGLLGDRESIGDLRAAVVGRQEAALRVEAAVGLGLLGDSGAVPILIGVLQDPKASQSILGSVAVSLGKIGDERAVEPLAKMLEDASCPDLTRALACVALGQIGDRSELPVLARVSEDINYRAYCDAVAELMTIL